LNHAVNRTGFDAFAYNPITLSVVFAVTVIGTGFFSWVAKNDLPTIFQQTRAEIDLTLDARDYYDERQNVVKDIFSIQLAFQGRHDDAVQLICQKRLEPYNELEIYPSMCAMTREFRDKIQAIKHPQTAHSDSSSIGYGSFNVQNSDSDEGEIIEIT